MTSVIREGRELEDRISLEQIPSAEPFLSIVIQAMRENKVLDLHYQSYERETPTVHMLHPYAVKLFKQRWYVIGLSEKKMNEKKKKKKNKKKDDEKLIDLENISNIELFNYMFDDKMYIEYDSDSSEKNDNYDELNKSESN